MLEVNTILLSKWKEKMNALQLKHKLFLSFVLVVFVPIIIIGGYLTYKLWEVALDDSVNQGKVTINRVKERTEEVLKLPIFISDNIALNNYLERIVTNKYNGIHDVVNDYRDFRHFMNYKTMYSEIYNIKLYVENDSLLNNWEIIPVENREEMGEWYINAKNEKGYAAWHYMKDETNNDTFFLSYVRRLDFLDHDMNAVLVINVNPNSFSWMLSQESESIMLTDKNGIIYASNSPSYIGKNIGEIIGYKNKRKSQLESSSVIDSEDAQIFIDTVPIKYSNDELKIYVTIPNESILNNGSYFMRIGITVVSISAIISIVLIYFISKLLTNRLLMLTKKMKQIGQGSFNIPVQIEGNDEVAVLSRHLNHMAQNIDQLVNELIETNKQKTLMERNQSEIKFKMMASQINPHFLFNALESIRMEAFIRGEKEIANVIRNLGNMMRGSIEVGGKLIQLKQEIDLVTSYLSIQTFRHEDRLSYTMEVGEAYYHVKIPPLIIQPLIENAVIHGLETYDHPVHITIRATQNGNSLKLEIIDNGKGMTQDKLNQILQTFEVTDEDQKMRIGLRNVHERLQLAYKGNNGLTITSQLNVGTAISFEIPLEEGLYCIE